MTELVVTVLLLAAAAGGQLLLRDLRTVPRGATGPRELPAVSVVIPARNEEQSLPGVLASLQRSALPLHEIVVVDDESQDATAAVATSGGARVVSPGAPPPGWTGKAWACQRGAEAAAGDVLLFLDADTVLAAPDALAGLLDLHARAGGLVSVQPHHRTERAYEQLSAYFNVVSLMACGAFTGSRSSRPMAFGPCLVTSRADYDRAGGHAAVRGEVLDDVSLARAYADADLPVRCAVGGEAIRMRSYPGGLGQLVAGWSKNVASGAAASAPLATLVAVAWICAHNAVAAGVLLALVEVATGWGGLAAGHPLLWAGGWVVLALQLRLLLARVGAFRWWTWALFPLPLLAFDLIFARSAALTVVRRSVRWRGREVDLRRPGSRRAGGPTAGPDREVA